jgi:hypothetical protein
LYNKIITDYASSTSSSSLPLLPSSNEGQQSHLRQTQGSQTYIHRREEIHLFNQKLIMRAKVTKECIRAVKIFVSFFQDTKEGQILTQEALRTRIRENQMN